MRGLLTAIICVIFLANSIYGISLNVNFRLSHNAEEFDYQFCLLDKNDINTKMSCSDYISRQCAAYSDNSIFNYHLCEIRSQLINMSFANYKSTWVYICLSIVSLIGLIMVLFSICLMLPDSENTEVEPLSVQTINKSSQTIVQRRDSSDIVEP